MINKYPILIFEGAELAGKSWLMAQIYDRLEKKYNKSGKVLDGCAWFNVDIGVLGTDRAESFLWKYVDIIRELNDRAMMLEKFHVTDAIYKKMNEEKLVDYRCLEDELLRLGVGLVLVDNTGDEALLQKRLQERLMSVKHYERIKQEPNRYVQMADEYRRFFEDVRLRKIKVDLKEIPNQKVVEEVLEWIEEIG